MPLLQHSGAGYWQCGIVGVVLVALDVRLYKLRSNQHGDLKWTSCEHSGDGDKLVRSSDAPCCKWQEHCGILQANFYAWVRKLRGDVNGLTTPSADSALIDPGAVSGPVADRSTGHVPKPAMATATATSTSTSTLRAIVNPSNEVRIDVGGGLYAIPGLSWRHAGNRYAETTKAWLGTRPGKDSGVPLATTVVQAPA
jgi:hypothetical protein